MNRDSDATTRRVIVPPPPPALSLDECGSRYYSSPIPRLNHSSGCSCQCQIQNQSQQSSIIDEALLAAIPPSNNNDKLGIVNTDGRYANGANQHNPMELSQDALARMNTCERLPSIRELLQSIHRVKSVPLLKPEPNETTVRKVSHPYCIHSRLMDVINPRRLAEMRGALPSPSLPHPPIMSPLHPNNLIYHHLHNPSHTHPPSPSSQRQNEASPQHPRKNHKCLVEGCQKTFPTKSRLNRHVIVHSGSKPFKCLSSSCGKAFSRKDNMLQHFKSHGAIEMKTATSETREEGPP